MITVKKYEKPLVIVDDGLYEGVYAASGDVTGTESSAPGCDSQYMNGVWQAPSYDWSNGTPTYKYNYGCLGCPAYRAEGCGLQIDQAYLDGATSYDVDNGNRMPTWESKGHTADELVTEFV